LSKEGRVQRSGQSSPILDEDDLDLFASDLLDHLLGRKELTEA